MICLNNLDTIEGGASVNAVIDYSIHGLVGTTFTNIAQGQLSNTNPSVLYTAGAAISIVSVIFVNTHSAAVTVDLYLDPANAATPRRLIPKTLTLGIGYSMHFDGQRLSILDANGAIITGVNVSDTAFAASWDGVTTIAPSKNSVWDGLGTGASPTHVGMTLSGATASLPLFTGASKELVSKSVADTRTALGLGVADSPTLTALTLTNGQIVFPATQNPSSDPNTLDDYEEGTWTPNLAFGGSTTGITYNASYHQGTYTKIGNVVRISLYLVLTSKGAQTGDATVQGLPFALPDADWFSPVFTMVPTNAVSYGSFPGCRGTNNSSIIALQKPSSTGVPANLTDADFANGSTFLITGTYKI